MISADQLAERQKTIINRKIVSKDLLPAFRGLDVLDITREKVKSLALACLQKSQSPKTVQNIIRCLSSLLSHAVEDALVLVNPALKPGKFLPQISKRRKIDPLTREEVAQLLDTAPRVPPQGMCRSVVQNRSRKFNKLEELAGKRPMKC